MKPKMHVLKRSFDQEKTKKEFNKVLWVYDLWGWLTERKAAKKVLKLANITNDSVILDVACGTGEMLKQIAEINPDGKNIGVDLSPEMLAKTREKLHKNGTKNFEVREGNALHLEFPDHTFDTLINSYMVDLLPQDTFNKIASEFYRVLNPNGILVMSTFSFGTKKMHKFWYWIAKTFPSLLTGCRPVSFTKYLMDAGFTVEQEVELSQNTFPSKIIKARKAG